MEERQDLPQEQSSEAGRKGGSAAMAAGMPYAETRAALAYWSPDTIRWGPVWSGLLVTLGVYLVLVSIGIGSAFSGFNPALATYGKDVSVFLSIWTAASLIVAVFIGAWIAGRTGALLGMRAGWYQGTVVWALALLFSTLLVSSFTFGLVGGLSAVTSAARLTVPGESVGAARLAASAIAYTAWVFLIASVLQWGAAVLGGWLGAMGKVQTAADEST